MWQNNHTSTHRMLDGWVAYTMRYFTNKLSYTAEKRGECMYVNLKAEMEKKNITVSDIAQSIRKTDRSIRDKINGNGNFTWSEVNSIRDSFFPGMSMEYLFSIENTNGKD